MNSSVKLASYYSIVLYYGNFNVFWYPRALAYALSCVKQEGLILKEQQVRALKLLSEGRDVFVWFPTGYGKSLCYQLLYTLLDGLQAW